MGGVGEERSDRGASGEGVIVKESSGLAYLAHESRGFVAFHWTTSGRVWVKHFPTMESPTRTAEPVVLMVDGTDHHIPTIGLAQVPDVETARKMWNILTRAGWRREER